MPSGAPPALDQAFSATSPIGLRAEAPTCIGRSARSVKPGQGPRPVEAGGAWVGNYSPYGTIGYNFATGELIDTSGEDEAVKRMFGVNSGSQYKSLAIDSTASDPRLTGHYRHPRGYGDWGAMIHDWTWDNRDRNLSVDGAKRHRDARDQFLQNNALQALTGRSGLVDPYDLVQTVGQAWAFGKKNLFGDRDQW